MRKFFNDGDIILFQGDSVTDCGRSRDLGRPASELLGSGYPLVFRRMYDMLFPDNRVQIVNRGVSGDKIRDLLERYDEDLLAVKPNVISLMIGINDTWHDFPDGNTPVDRFEKEYETLLRQLKADLPQTKLLILEQFAILSNPERSAWRDDLAEKRAVTRRLAEKYADHFIPIFDRMEEAERGGLPGTALAADGVHPAPTGHALIAGEILKELKIL